MNRIHLAATTLLLGLTAIATLGGCSHAGAQAQVAPPPPSVTVAQVVSRETADSEEFTGHFEAVQRVEVRPRVSGYISAVGFRDGSEVRKGQVLFVIDPRPYEAESKRAQAQLAQARSALQLAQSEQERAVKLLAAHAISREEQESRDAALAQAHANVDAAQAAVDSADLDLSFTRVTAPISGVVSRAVVTAGNLVAAGQTLLTTVVSVDPIYVSFDSDEQGFLRFMNHRRDAGAMNGATPVAVGLADEAGFPHQGQLAFVDNELDAATGTMRARGRLDNHDGRFTPGMFARVRLTGTRHYKALLVNDSAIGTDQNVRYVLVVGRDNVVQYRAVETGPLVDGLREIRSGLAADDTIVVNGLQHVRPGMVVAPQRVAMGEDAARGVMTAKAD